MLNVSKKFEHIKLPFDKSYLTAGKSYVKLYIKIVLESSILCKDTNHIQVFKPLYEKHLYIIFL